MLEITLKLEGKNKKFTQPKINLGGMRRLAEMDKNVKALRENGGEEENGLEMLDEMAFTIVALFANQFTFDELVEGLEFDNMDEFNEIVGDIFTKVSAGAGGKTVAKKPTTKPQSK